MRPLVVKKHFEHRKMQLKFSTIIIIHLKTQRFTLVTKIGYSGSQKGPKIGVLTPITPKYISSSMFGGP